jgi:hypothetical protein
MALHIEFLRCYTIGRRPGADPALEGPFSPVITLGRLAPHPHVETCRTMAKTETFSSRWGLILAGLGW